MFLAADAAELGRLTVRSGVGEPLRAEIEIVGTDANAGALSARMATPDEFWRAGLEPSPLIGAIRVAVVRPGKGRTVVQLTTPGPIDEPFVSLLVHLSSSGRQALREYPVLLEERGGTPAPAPPALPAVASALASAQSATRAASASHAAPHAPGASDGTHLVKPGESLASIAQMYRAADVALEQMMVATFRANAAAFAEGNMNRLPAGRTLAIPDAATARQVALDDAHRALATQREETAVDRAARSATRDQLRVSSAPEGKAGSFDGSARQDDVVALQHALKEANERIGHLQDNVEALQRLVELQGRQLGRLQQAATVAAAGRGDAIAADMVPPGPPLPEPDLGRAAGRFVGLHWPWFATALLLAFTAWVWMPLKTARLWRKKRRRRDRELRRALRPPRMPGETPEPRGPRVSPSAAARSRRRESRPRF